MSFIVGTFSYPTNNLSAVKQEGAEAKQGRLARTSDVWNGEASRRKQGKKKTLLFLLPCNGLLYLGSHDSGGTSCAGYY